MRIRGRSAAMVLLALLFGQPALRSHAEDSPAADSNQDPLEAFNRPIFWFNETADRYVVEPIAKGWDTIAPDRVQESVANFFENVRSPVVAINNLLQGKLRNLTSDVERFVINTTVGLGGFFDPAVGLGLEKHNEDFGQTLGYWGVPAGPYLMLPVLGPSNPRDGVGLIVDSFTAVYPIFTGGQYTIGARVLDAINFRAQVLDQVREARQASVDYYAAVRDAYNRRRQVLVNDGAEMSPEEEEELYYFEDEE
jgi:phospholipid-binding lipoprotein MlaA